ncbi:hypothetical protein DBV15_08147 [Temnothorax longispinosus]|uniref:Uncharacterized protein n=1 Tax=Temnothorax longispinosus TaxID=300112 RepID=A0A4S2L3D3_9HYME|nr:hypothetical protein DBV15_08147 [Temnothorax longispinosus]
MRFAAASDVAGRDRDGARGLDGGKKGDDGGVKPLQSKEARNCVRLSPDCGRVRRLGPELTSHLHARHQIGKNPQRDSVAGAPRGSPTRVSSTMEKRDTLRFKMWHTAYDFLFEMTTLSELQSSRYGSRYQIATLRRRLCNSPERIRAPSGSEREERAGRRAGRCT